VNRSTIAELSWSWLVHSSC